MASSSADVYPRPDFQRTDLTWKSLNGPWDFIFDDDDVGLLQHWQKNGLPDQTCARESKGALGPEAKSITEKIAAGTQNLLKDNNHGDSAAKENQRRTIQVPFVFQSPASGINERGVHEVLWYERRIADLRTAEAKAKGDRLLLRFGAVDYDATVWINGQYVGGHRGGHVPWDVDITDTIEPCSADSRLILRVYDSAYDLTQPRGKQYWGAQPESIFYTPSSGIWQTSWMEVVPAARIADSSHGTILRSNGIENGQLHARIAVVGRRVAQKCSVELEACIGGVTAGKADGKELPKDTDHVKLDINMRLTEDQRTKLPGSLLKDAPLNNDRCWLNGVALWSPEHPLLYDLTIRLLDQSRHVLDEVKTSTGMRSLDWTTGDGTFRLNGRPLFQALCLDQGYWQETFMTPPSPEALKTDVELSKRMGFNGCRKHQKVEDPIFYHWADRLGYLVWGEMANAYHFSKDYVERFDQEWIESVKRSINHPCIVTWTPVNESWGYPSLKDYVDQRNHIRSLYYQTKTLDPTRSINDNCGWEHVSTDLTTFHDYADEPALTVTCSTMQGILGPKADREVFVSPIANADSGAQPRVGAPVLCTELGGVNIAPAQEEGKGERDWGYTTASDPQDLLRRIERLLMGAVKGGHICGFVYTQLADIEQEVNGLYSFDRKEKLDSKQMKAVFDEVQKVYYGKHDA